jgi:hypothetical protein
MFIQHSVAISYKVRLVLLRKSYKVRLVLLKNSYKVRLVLLKNSPEKIVQGSPCTPDNIKEIRFWGKIGLGAVTLLKKSDFGEKSDWEP